MLSNYLCAAIMRRKAMGWHFEYAYYDCNYMAAWYLTPALQTPPIFFFLTTAFLLQGNPVTDKHFSPMSQRICFSLWCDRFTPGNNDQASTSLFLHMHSRRSQTWRNSRRLKTVQRISHHTVLISVIKVPFFDIHKFIKLLSDRVGLSNDGIKEHEVPLKNWE